jgi:hypothetical protein
VTGIARSRPAVRELSEYGDSANGTAWYDLRQGNLSSGQMQAASPGLPGRLKGGARGGL